MEEYVTRTRFRLAVDIVSPSAFAELKEKHRYYDDQFVYVVVSPESGAELNEIYEPPDRAPAADADPAEQELYRRWLAWRYEYERRMIQYEADRARLLLALAVDEILEGPPGLDVEEDMRAGRWITKLQRGGIEVTDANRWLLYLKTVVLKTDVDLHKVFELATVDEVTMADIVSAIAWFQNLLARAATGGVPVPVASGDYQRLAELLGKSDYAAHAYRRDELVQTPES